MNAPNALQNIRSKHPVAYVVLYLFVGWALLVVITHAIAFGAELLIASSDQPVVNGRRPMSAPTEPEPSTTTARPSIKSSRSR